MTVAESRGGPVTADAVEWLPGDDVGDTSAGPRLRADVERVELTSVRDIPYTMLRSPDDPARARYLRLAPDEAALAELMDGTRPVPHLVAEFARISGRLAPDQVARVVADLAGNRILEDPVRDTGRDESPEQHTERPRAAWPVRLGRAVLSAVRGRRVPLGNPDALLSALYRYGGRWLFTPACAGVTALFAAGGLGLFGWTWWQGSQPLFLSGGSYLAGIAVLLGLFPIVVACHRLAQALATRHAGRGVPAAGIVFSFGAPSVYFDTTELWLADRRARLLATVCGPAASLALAGLAQLTGLFLPATGGVAFKLGFLWYLHTLVVLNPLLPLDGQWLLADWLEVPDLRTRALAWLTRRLRIRPRRARRSGSDPRTGDAATRDTPTGGAPTGGAPTRERGKDGWGEHGWGEHGLAADGGAADSGAADDRTADLRTADDRAGGNWAGGNWAGGNWAGGERSTGGSAGRPDGSPGPDREAQFVAWYGVLAALWLLVTAGLCWRVWTDRVTGLATGLWPAGWANRLLLVAVLAALAAPIPYALAGSIGRAARRLAWRRTVRGGGDPARRLAALRSSPLRQLPEAALDRLAARATWLRPGRGEPVVPAGAPRPDVLVVVDGTVIGRRPGDPAGTVRKRLGAGGLIGLGGALTGTPDALVWHTAGATLLALPAPDVAAAFGPLPGPPAAIRAEVERLFAGTPALEALSPEDRTALAISATPRHLGPDEPIYLHARNSALVVGSGTIVLPEGTSLRRGTMIGPVDTDLPDPVAFSRTAVRLWYLPPVVQLPTLLGDAVQGTPGQRTAGAGRPATGAHPDQPYPPLDWPAGPPPADVDDLADRRFARILCWLAALLAVTGLGLAGGALLPGPAWAEMPTDRALLTSERGEVTATLRGGGTVRLRAGERRYLRAGDQVEVGTGAEARMTFRGGSATVLCPSSHAQVAEVGTAGARWPEPRARLVLGQGRLLADTETPGRAFEPLRLAVENQGHTVVNSGPAWYAVDAGEVTVATGQVRRDGVPQPMTPKVLGCGDGVPVERPAGTPSEPPDPTAGPTPTGTPSATPSATPSPSASPTRTPSPSAQPTKRPTPTPPVKDPTKPNDPVLPPRNNPPVVGLSVPGETVQQMLADGSPCAAGPTTTTVSVSVSDDGGADGVAVTLIWSGLGEGRVDLSGGAARTYTFGPYPASEIPDDSATVTVRAQATDGKHTVTTASASFSIGACTPPPDGG